MDSEELLKFVLKALSDLIFKIEQIKVTEKKYTITINDDDGKVIKTIAIP